ncbi:hypothetical protein NE237_024675 [Protea cynaroides]|uniref:Uncharacterized protein n=1 Tax=Protea cynaroides TaxID=273540 RepID=A0A9Q0H5M4_9MAGN|nr:hypothetical protein NE237_024675 [Protea cynaroides]
MQPVPVCDIMNILEFPSFAGWQTLPYPNNPSPPSLYPTHPGHPTSPKPNTFHPSPSSNNHPSQEPVPPVHGSSSTSVSSPNVWANNSRPRTQVLAVEESGDIGKDQPSMGRSVEVNSEVNRGVEERLVDRPVEGFVNRTLESGEREKDSG